MKFLLIEDDAATASCILAELQEDGHVIDHATFGREGLFLGGANRYDVIIVDRMLPDLDGLSIVKLLRCSGTPTPILFLSAMGSREDRVDGLQAGGDDYLVKPFGISELLAHVNALARRQASKSEETVFRIADLELDLLKRSVTRAGRKIALQPREFSLLEFLMRRPGQIITRAMLREGVWGYHFDPKTNVVETHISRLRTKINRDHTVDLIQTIRGAGYVIGLP